MSAEDAVAKAKAIAAKLSGGDISAASPAVNALDVAAAAEAALASAGLGGGGGEKRKRWGVAADAAPEADDASKRTKHEAQKRIWISTSSKPASHYRLYWKQHGLAIGRQVSAGEIALSLHGRGSSTTPSLPGMPEQPLHLLIEGPTMESCENAEPLVEALFIAKADEAPTMVDADQPQDAAAGAGAVGGGGYQPAPVASLIHSQGGGDHYGGGGAQLEEQIGVPNGVVGYIIGRGGESIASMQSRTGCKVQIQKENEMKPGQTQRVITLQATTKEAIDQCRSIIQGMVNERVQSTSRDSFAGGGGGGGGGNNSQEARTKEAVQSGHVLVTVAVPDTDVGLIIGKAGSTIKGIQDRSGANIQIPQAGDLDNPNIRTVSITHPHGEGANLAKQLIEDILGSKKNQAPQITIQVEIPDKDVGMCIGRSGCVIREMQNQSGTKIQIPSFSTPGQQTRVATVVGPADGCNRVKQMIERIVLEQSSQSVMSGQEQQNGGGYGGGQNYGGGGGGGYQQQQQQGGYGGGGGGGYGQQHQQQGGYGGGGGGYGQQQAYGQQQQQQPQQAAGQDYSKEWAAYYAAQAAAQGGGAAAAQTRAPAPAAAPAAAAVSNGAASGTTDSTYHEQYFRYAYYYGDDAARKHYGAWSPAPGTPNPYGVNPNGVTAAPAAAPGGGAPAAAAPAPVDAAAVAAAASAARDTGRRGVSNLPAWMTKK